MRAGSEPTLHRPSAVFKQGFPLLGLHRGQECLPFCRFQRAGLEERHSFQEDCRIPRRSHIGRDGKRQPEQVIRDSRPDAGSGGWMPPMLHITLLELPGGRRQDQIAGYFRLSVKQGQDILQLVPIAVRPAGLIEARTSPDPAA